MRKSTQTTSIKNTWKTSSLDVAAKKQLTSYLSVPLVFDIPSIVKKLEDHRDKRAASDKAYYAKIENQDKDPKKGYRSQAHFYDDNVVIMEAAGFVSIHHLETVGFNYNGTPIGQESSGERKRVSDIWIHPSGILATSSSHGQDDQRRPGHNSLTIYSQVDVGMGKLAIHASLGLMRNSSSSYDFQMHGGHVHHTSLTANSYQDEAITHLDQLQKSGLIAPFSNWNTGEHFGLFSPEKLICVEDHPELFHPDVDQHKIIAQLYWDKAHDLIASQPEDIQQILKSIIYKDISYRSDDKAQINKHLRQLASENHIEFLDPQFLNPSKRTDDCLIPDYIINDWAWRAAEPGLLYLEQVADSCMSRFWSDNDQKTVREWTGLASKNPLKPIDPQNPCVHKYATGKANFGNFLVHQADHNNEKSNASDILKGLLSSVDIDTLRTWCSVPDATGKTLPMHMCSVVINRTYPVHRAQGLVCVYDDLLKIITSRLPSSDIVMSTPQVSAWGMWAMALLTKSTNQSLRQVEELVKPWLDAGVDVGSEWSYTQNMRAEYREHKKDIIHPAKTVSHSSVGEFVDAYPDFAQNPDVCRMILTAVLDAQPTQAERVNRAKSKM